MLLCPGWGRKGFPGEHGLAQPHTCLQARFPTCCYQSGVSPTLRRWAWPCPNLLAVPGCPTAGVSGAPGHAVPHPLEPVAIEGPRLPSAGSAAQEQQEPGSALLEVAPQECVLILLGSQGIAHPPAGPWSLVAVSPWAGFPGDRAGSPFPFRPCCSCPAPPTLPLGQDVPPALPVAPEVLASGTKSSVRIHRALNKGAPSNYRLIFLLLMVTVKCLFLLWACLYFLSLLSSWQVLPGWECVTAVGVPQQCTLHISPGQAP